MLKIYDSLPDMFLVKQSNELHQILSGPSLFLLPGKGRPLFLSTLLHGNETTGFEAIKHIIKNNTHRNRALIIFIGNPLAAKESLRHLDGQMDFNRIWEDGALPENILAKEVKQKVLAQNPYAAVDIHNNTGKNPFYSCFNKKEKSHLALSNLFSQTIVYFKTPKNTLSVYFAEHIPTTTIECGQVDQPDSKAFALKGLEKLLLLDDSSKWSLSEALEYYYLVQGKVTIPDNITFSFNDIRETLNDLVFSKDFDSHNFEVMDKDTIFAQISPDVKEVPVYIQNSNAENITSDYLTIKNNKLILEKEIVPSMLTLDKQIVRQDCLGYVMTREKIHNLL